MKRIRLIVFMPIIMVGFVLSYIGLVGAGEIPLNKAIKALSGK